MVEQAPQLRKTGGHAIDLFGPAMEIAEAMGVLDQVMAHATGTERITFHRSGARRPARINYRKLSSALSDRHVEIMRDAFGAYQRVMQEPVLGARASAKSMAKDILPSSHLGVRALTAAGQLISILPTPLTATVAGLNSRGIRLYASITVPQCALTDL